MKKRSMIVPVLMAMMLILLTGCSMKEAVTSRRVVPSEDEKRLDITLKADTEKGYEWKYIALAGNLTESQSNLQNDLFSDTYIEEYVLSMNDTLTDTLVLFLIQNGDTENAKAYLYDISFDGEKIKIGDPVEKTVGYDKDLMSAIERAK